MGFFMCPFIHTQFTNPSSLKNTTQGHRENMQNTTQTITHALDQTGYHGQIWGISATCWVKMTPCWNLLSLSGEVNVNHLCQSSSQKRRGIKNLALNYNWLYTQRIRAQSCKWHRFAAATLGYTDLVTPIALSTTILNQTIESSIT